VKRLIATVFAALAIAPAAQAQDWQHQKPGSQECFAITMRGDRAFVVQGPLRDGGNQGAIIFIGPLGALHDGAGDILFTFDPPGKWARPKVGYGADEPDLTGAMFTLDQFSDLEALPDRFRVKVSRGKQVALDTEITEFRATLTAVRSCVAAR
jgi:hypothetical protein